MGAGRARRRRNGVKRLAGWIAATLLGAIVPAALVAVALGSVGVLAPAFALTLGHAVVLGLPAALLYRRLNWRSPAYALAGGLVIGAVPGGGLAG
jgi:hypothetical protein